MHQSNGAIGKLQFNRWTNVNLTKSFLLLTCICISELCPSRPIISDALPDDCKVDHRRFATVVGWHPEQIRTARELGSRNPEDL